jgi:predicted dehydrogenase
MFSPKQPEGVTRCASLAELLAVPLDTLFITTASLHHLEVLEQAIASAVPRIVIEKPIVATLPQIEKLNALLATRTRLPACWRSITGWRASKR